MWPGFVFLKGKIYIYIYIYIYKQKWWDKYKYVFGIIIVLFIFCSQLFLHLDLSQEKRFCKDKFVFRKILN